MTETLPKLQQYFLTQGIYVHFIDCNLNWDLDISRNPYYILRYMKELHHAYRTSTGLFLLVRKNLTKKNSFNKKQFSSRLLLEINMVQLFYLLNCQQQILII